MRQSVPHDLSGAMAGLARQVDGLRTDVDALADLHEDIASLRGDLAAHARALADLVRISRPDGDPALAAAPPPATDPRDVVPDWLTVCEPGLAVAWLTDLVAWVPRVWARYPGSAMPGCWHWHPAIVAELLVARHMWADATLPGQSVMGLAQWHERWRPSAATRVTKALTGCDRGGGCHVNPAGRHFHYDLAALDDLAVWWATTDRPDLDAAPGLAAEIGQHRRGPARPAVSPRAHETAS